MKLCILFYYYTYSSTIDFIFHTICCDVRMFCTGIKFMYVSDLRIMQRT